MQVTVLLFAGSKQAAGKDQLQVALPPGATFSDLAIELAQCEPALQPLLAHARFAADAQYVAATDPVPAGVELALIPPVSGG